MQPRSMRTFVFLISLGLITHSHTAFSQLDSVYNDSTWHKQRFIPTGVRIGLDAISLGQVFGSSDIKQWKLAADVDFYRYFLNFEFGTFERQWNTSSSVYNNEGTYFKIGPDINLLHRDPDQSALFFGIRYAISNYKDEISFTTNNDFWGNSTAFEENRDLTSSWFEMTTGLKVKLYKWVWSGYTARFKFRVNETYSANDLVPHWIPGYGLAQEESQWGFEYYLIFRIPFKQYIPAPKKKS